MNQQAQQNEWLLRQVLRADPLNALWWVTEGPWRSRLNLLSMHKPVPGGTNVFPRQPSTSLAPAVLCGMCSFICIYLDYYMYRTSTPLHWLAAQERSSPLELEGPTHWSTYSLRLKRNVAACGPSSQAGIWPYSWQRGGKTSLVLNINELFNTASAWVTG